MRRLKQALQVADRAELLDVLLYNVPGHAARIKKIDLRIRDDQRRAAEVQLHISHWQPWLSRVSVGVFRGRSRSGSERRNRPCDRTGQRAVEDRTATQSWTMILAPAALRLPFSSWVGPDDHGTSPHCAVLTGSHALLGVGSTSKDSHCT